MKSKRFQVGSRPSLFERNKFFGTTTLAGFRYIQQSNSRLEVFFWYLLIGSFLCITSKNVYSLASQYISQTTVTRVSIGRLNRTYDLKTFELRLQIGLPEMRFGKEEVERALAKLDTREKFMRHWDYVLLSVVSRWPRLNQDAIREHIQKIFKHARQFSISEDQVIQLLGRQVLRWLKFTIRPAELEPSWRTHSYGSLAVEKPNAPVLFAYEMDPNQPVNVGLGNTNGLCLSVDVSHVVQYTVREGLLWPNATFNDALKWYKKSYNASIEIHFGYDNRMKLHSKLGDISYWSYEIASSFHSSTNCLTNNSRHECTRNCTRNVIEEQCNCSPVLVGPKNETILNPCTPDHYKDCLKAVGGNIRDKCRNGCPSDCDIDFIEIRLADRGDLTETGMEICINIFHKEVPTFNEHYAQSWQQFLAELGGAIDFWLGASVVSLVHLIVHLLKQLLYKLKPNAKTGNKPKETEAKHKEQKEPESNDHIAEEPQSATVTPPTVYQNGVTVKQPEEEEDPESFPSLRRMTNTRSINRNGVCGGNRSETGKEAIERLEREHRMCLINRKTIQELKEEQKELLAEFQDCLMYVRMLNARKNGPVTALLRNNRVQNSSFEERIAHV